LRLVPSSLGELAGLFDEAVVDRERDVHMHMIRVLHVYRVQAALRLRSSCAATITALDVNEIETAGFRNGQLDDRHLRQSACKT